MFERVTAEARQVLALVPRYAVAAGRSEITPADLAAALAARPIGNTAGVWTTPPSSEPAEPTNVPSGGTAPNKPPRFNRAARAALERSLRVALDEAARHVGTEHLLAALVRGGPPDVAAGLGALGATADAVDALLARLAGKPGAEGPPEDPRAANGAGSALTYTRLTVDARAVVRQSAALGRAAGRTNVTPVDLATALALYGGGNVARLWTEASVPPPQPAAPINDFAALAGPTEQVLGTAATIAREAGAAQVGTEHLLVALIRHDHPEVVTLLAGRGGTAEAAAALIAELAGEPGVEALPPAARRPWWRAMPSWQVNVALSSLAVVLVIVVVCVLGPIFGP
ncbi:Clp protease N-terminal domain-containing protein [Dactylosporangium sp. AC04546]|uniref:Clp protease N-terminal domain-containing protein n=1 Tax=Dactylosporangium sp. AC04546 TaxID=2862460 RepID=UPI002E7B73BF|nr:Clp protease N-terminal domain-containing protein [Dactylosporangium sp. AC04546]WVK86375.1 Clp protease N-terminal domain-containing protein [Dactylosporangium sp. AC04546]